MLGGKTHDTMSTEDPAAYYRVQTVPTVQTVQALTFILPRDAAEERSLLTTGSSDFHGPDHPHFNRFRVFETPDPAKRGTRGLHQLTLHGRQRRISGQRDADDIALGRPDERLRFGHEAGFVVYEPHAGNCLDGGKGTPTSLFRKCVGSKGDVAAKHRDPGLIEHPVLENGAAARGKVDLDLEPSGLRCRIIFPRARNVLNRPS